ncbi:glycosyltransferase [Lujinxingia sediminis]|uniref:glycosyltransferase n=1 Tax=Lujinxingia sediminis TaxID=2480984 RepID=UPI0013E350B3|nr:glycosyltransferase [Lujinxingia sediminis]
MLLTSLILAPIALATTIGIFNLLTWPRRLKAASPPPAISVLIPARNEEANIEDCIRSVAAAAQAYPEMNLEIIAYDDHSTDRTSEILEKLSGELPALRIPRAQPLPSGWAGKCHACHQLATHATHPQLLFIDADVRLLTDALTGLAAWQKRYNADVVSAVPAQVTGSFFEHLILPLLHLTYVSWLPLLLIPHTRRADFLAMNGQILMTSRQAYERIGGFEAIRNALVDDMAFGRRAKEAGLTVAFADGTHLARCRMYRDAPSVWEGFTKNIYPGMGKNPALLLLVITLYFSAFVLPFILLPLSGLVAALAPLTTPLLAAVALNLTYRILLAIRFSHPPLSVLLHPLGVVALIAIALNSFRQTLRGQLTWAGRTYPDA